MTECERIIQQGILPESFFKPDTICDFYVDETRKKIWAVEIDLCMELLRVCSKYNLKIWADGGTLLGAIRHNGFIPWDDDMDMVMPRDDYEKLMEIGPEEFCYPYFLQNPHTDTHYGYSFAKLRNTNTTCIPKVFSNAGFNHGIHIDIFPLDVIALETFEQEKLEITKHIMRCSSYMKRNNVDLLNEIQMKNFHLYKTDSPEREYDAIQAICLKHKDSASEYVANCTFTGISSSSQIWRKEWFKHIVYHKFEQINMPIPEAYVQILTTTFGDYMKFPPKEQRGQWHTNVFWDPDKSYTKYI